MKLVSDPKRRATNKDMNVSKKSHTHLIFYFFFVGNSKKTREELKVGDIVWAKLGKYPYWPSIISKDPTSKTHVKGDLGKHFILT